jgi:RNA polymerase sigma-70 factor (ECF subfamily)
VILLLDEPEQLAVIRGLQSGDCDAWCRLYDAYSVDIWRYVARLLGSGEEAVADVVQETFLAAARSARAFAPERGTLWTWLCGIAHHGVAAHWRDAQRLKRARQLAEQRAAEFELWFSGPDSPDSLVERAELADVVRMLLAGMSGDYAALLSAKYLDDQTLVQLVERFGGTVESVKSKLARARREFREAFERTVRTPSRGISSATSQ